MNKCPICEKQSTEKCFAHDYRHCTDCNFYFLDGEPDIDSTGTKEIYGKKYYSRGSINFTGLVSLAYNAFDYAEIVDFIRDRQPVLDVGCGSGSFLLHLRRNNIDGFGIDTSAAAIACAGMSGVPKEKLVNSGIENINMQENTFGSATSLHVIEHISDPSSYLQGIYKVLKPGGIIIIRAPNIDSTEARLGKEKWLLYDYPYHVAHYTPKALRLVLERNGFINVNIRFNATQYRQNLLYSFLIAIGVRSISKKVKILLLPLQLLFVPISVCMALLFKDSGTIEAIGFKPEVNPTQVTG